ncbi:hypothetical protein [Photorhabdus namnaonensis]|uniref:Uncharacterized protein n=1 Tax=Photorhabdus namnaonensis TaxID=1851568 RepID=A0A1B8YCQ3_9GAMM|nr:hypothetical protein [Photorhabdus namnaonensis]OCA52906.1 hypothetical protein Phpb_03958 [Photorhabdus namnaonensis]
MKHTKLGKIETGQMENSLRLATFSQPVSLAGAVPRTLSGSEAGRVLGFGCRSCTESSKNE